MMRSIQKIKKILCIRPDNMGDVIMSTPAFRALRQHFKAHITLLTSPMGAPAAPFIPCIDEVITFQAPWVKLHEQPDDLFATVEQLKAEQFDLAVIFSVYSQSTIPSILLAYLAGIPFRLAYCRENPYHLLTHWVPDKEPYDCIHKHQVERDLDLVAYIGAFTDDHSLCLEAPRDKKLHVRKLAQQKGLDLQRPWIVLHPGVSEAKRKYGLKGWTEAGKRLVKETGAQLLITGNEAERAEAEILQSAIGMNCYSIAGELDTGSFISLVAQAPLVISVNTGTVHIAAATQTPVLVLYAKTNPQHTPWNVASKVLFFDVPSHLHSKNEVVRYALRHYSWEGGSATPDAIVEGACELLQGSARSRAMARRAIP